MASFVLLSLTLPLLLAAAPLDAGHPMDAGVDAGPVDAGPPPRAPDGGLPPHGLACLAEWYVGQPCWSPDAGWAWRLPKGELLAWEDGRPVTDPDDGGAPDLADLYRTPYQPGPIVALDASDAGPISEPGRVRAEQLFLATYGASVEEVMAHLGRVRFFGLRYPFHERACGALERVVARLEPQVKANPKLRPFLEDIGGTWHWRRIARSKNLSAHAFGIAIDLNADRGAYWRWQKRGEPLKWQNRVPQEIVDAFEAEGFIWGGRWLHYDTMHFEYRPELLSPDCR